MLQILSNLSLAIGEMFLIAFLMGLGTFIDQGESPDHYFQKCPEDHPVLRFFTWRWVLDLGFDHMFSSPIFLGMLALLGASLMAYTYTTQIPLIKEFSESLLRASIEDVGTLLMGAGHEEQHVFLISIMEQAKLSSLPEGGKCFMEPLYHDGEYIILSK
ncbi:cytochrome c biogenesis protein CCS1, chloroplastic-like [Lotus japonicus]|uniref:cytochrome c biogenesis protein CCS1, chloroplastic-like n=1 Tax=Lotus japonicus TaxID=34305 RepID=UPI00258BB36D|nr:cytochrome c biogenesis protein CCS1, chloroplastic-like [Lotus japonicus]